MVDGANFMFHLVLKISPEGLNPQPLKGDPKTGLLLRMGLVRHGKLL